jgi:hypothetical protein
MTLKNSIPQNKSLDAEQSVYSEAGSVAVWWRFGKMGGEHRG